MLFSLSFKRWWRGRLGNRGHGRAEASLGAGVDRVGCSSSRGPTRRSICKTPLISLPVRINKSSTLFSSWLLWLGWPPLFYAAKVTSSNRPNCSPSAVWAERKTAFELKTIARPRRKNVKGKYIIVNGRNLWNNWCFSSLKWRINCLPSFQVKKRTLCKHMHDRWTY